MKYTVPGLILGGIPRADLLPPEIRAANRDKSIVRMALTAVVVVAALVAGGIGYATFRALTSENLLQEERIRSDDLLAQQLQYAEVRQIANQVDDAITARRLGTTTEIDWKSYLDEVNATLPSGVTLTSITVDYISPIESAGSVEGPLQEDSVAKLSITATSATVPDVEAWLNDLTGLTGFAGIAPPATVNGSVSGGYNVAIEVLVNKDAYLLRFQSDEGVG